jgi:release factor glutamine methyltransferase
MSRFANLTIAQAMRLFEQALYSELAVVQDIGEARAETRLALAWAMDIQFERLALTMQHRVDARGAERLEGVLAGRARREPLQYLLGEAGFMDLVLSVGPGVLIPRADTEVVAQCALDSIASKITIKSLASVRILEIGPGTGAICIFILRRLANLGITASATAIDISPQAVDATRKNALRLGLQNLEVIEGDYLEVLSRAGNKDLESFDLIVSNPPYIPSTDIEGLAPEVREHEPHLALCGSGSDGLGFYRDFASFFPRCRATAHADIVVEHGDGQSKDIEQIFVAAGYGLRERVSDLGQRLRALSFEAPEKNI